MEYINYINSFSNAQAIDDALSAGTLQRPYTALDLSTGKVVFGKVLPPEPAETRLKITYNFETTDETIVLANMRALFHDAPGKAEFPDGTEFIYDPEGEYESYDIKYTPSAPGIASIYYTFSGDTIGSTIASDDPYDARLLYSEEGGVRAPAISLEIPDQVNTIGNFAFGEALYSAITIPNHSLTIGKRAFDCTGGYIEVGQLVSINNGENTIPSGSVLCGGTFCGQALEEITIGQGVTFGLDGADGDFSFCFDLKSITFLDTTPPSVNGDTVRWVSEGEPVVIHVPVGSENAYVDSFNQDCDGYAFRYISPGIIEASEKTE